MMVQHRAGLFFDRHAGPVAHVLAAAGELVEEGGFAAVLVTGQGKGVLHEKVALFCQKLSFGEGGRPAGAGLCRQGREASRSRASESTARVRVRERRGMCLGCRLVAGVRLGAGIDEQPRMLAALSPEKRPAPNGASVSSAILAQETRQVACGSCFRRTNRSHQPSGGSEGSQALRMHSYRPAFPGRSIFAAGAGRAHRSFRSPPSGRFGPSAQVSTGHTLPSGAGRAGSLRPWAQTFLTPLPAREPSEGGREGSGATRRKRPPQAGFSDAHRRVIFLASSRRRVRA